MEKRRILPVGVPLVAFVLVLGASPGLASSMDEDVGADTVRSTPSWGSDPSLGRATEATQSIAAVGVFRVCIGPQSLACAADTGTFSIGRDFEGNDRASFSGIVTSGSCSEYWDGDGTSYAGGFSVAGSRYFACTGLSIGYSPLCSFTMRGVDDAGIPAKVEAQGGPC